MKVDQLMTRNARACQLEDTLETAARIMWDNDCGCVPVVDGDGRVLGMLTDRDICMAAYLQGGPLRVLSVRSCMSGDIVSCAPDDPLQAAEKAMQSRRVRRLPVVDATGHLAGIISLNDIALEAEREAGRRKPAVGAHEVGHTLAAICSRGEREVSVVA
jgi:CBS domain-containing protein